MIDKMCNTIVNDKVKSVYSFNDYSIQDLLSKFFEQINSVTDLVNQNEEKINTQNFKLEEFINYMKSEGIPPIVIETLTTMYNDGRLTELFNSLANNVIDKVEEFKEQFNTQLEQKAPKSELEVERERINNIVKNSGTTINDVELQDIRVGYDGIVYGSAGDSVREQSSTINNSNNSIINSLKNINENFNKLIKISDTVGFPKFSDVEGLGTVGSTFLNGFDTSLYWHNSIINVTEKKIYLVDLRRTSNSAFKQIFFLDVNNKVIKNEFSGGISEDVKKYVVIPPSGATKIVFISYQIRLNIYELGNENLNLKNVYSNIKTDEENIISNKISVWNGSGRLSYNEYPCVFTKPNKNCGVRTIDFKPDLSKFMKIKIKGSFDINFSENDVLRVYLWGANVGSLATAKDIDLSRNIIDFEWLIDPAYYKQYKNEDTFYIIIATSSEGTINIESIEVTQNELYQYKEYGNTLHDTLRNIYQNNNRINSEISLLKNNANSSSNEFISPNGTSFLLSVNDDGQPIFIKKIPKKSLFLGNSLVFGCKTEHGLTATKAEYDYYNKLKKFLTEKNNGSYTQDKLYSSWWESYTTDGEKDNFLNTQLIPKLSNDIDFVSIQLGDNVNTEGAKTIFKESALKLIRTIKSHCPKARIVWVAEWYLNASLTDIADVCKQTGSEFINISDIRNSETEGKIGDVITLSDGSTYTITDSGSASHPGNKGHLGIANRIAYSCGWIENEGDIK